MVRKYLTLFILTSALFVSCNKELEEPAINTIWDIKPTYEIPGMMLYWRFVDHPWQETSDDYLEISSGNTTQNIDGEHNSNTSISYFPPTHNPQWISSDLCYNVNYNFSTVFTKFYKKSQNGWTDCTPPVLRDWNGFFFSKDGHQMTFEMKDNDIPDGGRLILYDISNLPELIPLANFAEPDYYGEISFNSTGTMLAKTYLEYTSISSPHTLKFFVASAASGIQNIITLQYSTSYYIDHSPPSWTYKDDKIIFAVEGEIYMIQPNGTVPENITQTPGIYESLPKCSPVDDVLLYTVQDSQHVEIKLMDLSSLGSTLIFSDSSANKIDKIVWSSDGQNILFFCQQLMNYSQLESGIFLLNRNGQDLIRFPFYDINPDEFDWISE